MFPKKTVNFFAKSCKIVGEIFDGKDVNMYADNHQVRIIGGKFKGKLLRVGQLDGLRPTPDRVRETVFTWLGDRCEGARVLDLFAGSGALGCEALSRGAADVTLIEIDKKNSKNLEDATADMDNIMVLNTDAIAFIKQATGVYDLVFLDPPYKADLLEDCLLVLLDRELIDENTLLYVEMNAGNTLAVPGYEVIREETAGQVKYALWKKAQMPF